MRILLTILLLFLAGCSDSSPAEPVPLDGSYSGGNGVYSDIHLTLIETESGVTGTLLLRDDAGDIVFDGPVAGARVGPNGFELAGGRAPSVGGGTIEVDGTRTGTTVQVTLSSSWLPSTTIVLRQESGLMRRVPA